MGGVLVARREEFHTVSRTSACLLLGSPDAAGRCLRGHVATPRRTGIPGARPTGASPRCAAALEFARQTRTKTTAAQARG